MTNQPLTKTDIHEAYSNIPNVILFEFVSVDDVRSAVYGYNQEVTNIIAGVVDWETRQKVVTVYDKWFPVFAKETDEEISDKDNYVHDARGKQ